MDQRENDSLETGLPMPDASAWVFQKNTTNRREKRPSSLHRRSVSDMKDISYIRKDMGIKTSPWKQADVSRQKTSGAKPISFPMQRYSCRQPSFFLGDDIHDDHNNIEMVPEFSLSQSTPLEPWMKPTLPNNKQRLQISDSRQIIDIKPSTELPISLDIDNEVTERRCESPGLMKTYGRLLKGAVKKASSSANLHITEENYTYSTNSLVAQKADKSAFCDSCSEIFSFKTRKRRCKNCDLFFCRECSNYKFKIQHKGEAKRKRVCHQCYTKLNAIALLAEDNYVKSHRTLENSYKLVILGPSGSGKTTFIQKSVIGNTPTDGELFSMVGVATLPYDLPMTDAVIPFHIWDINGNQRYFHLLDSYCKGLDCCILAFDIAAVMSLEELEKPWVQIIAKFDRTNTVVALLGLKSEQKQRNVSVEEATLFAKSKALDFYLEVSSRDSSTLSFVYERIAAELITRQGKLFNDDSRAVLNVMEM